MNIEQRINKYFISLVFTYQRCVFHSYFFEKNIMYVFLCEFENTMLQSFLAVFVEIFKEKNKILF